RPWGSWPRPWWRWCSRVRRCASSAGTPWPSSPATTPRSWAALAEDSRPRRVLLIGMMGAGKSTVGPALAERLGWSYLDSDEQVADVIVDVGERTADETVETILGALRASAR